MSDFKALYDRALSAQANVQEILNQINTALQLGTEEGAEEALALEAKLDEATAKRDEAQKFYDKVKNAHQSNQVAVNFLPVSETPATPEEEKPAGVMKRNEFFALSTADREMFVKRGGKIEDQ
jgi:hypothetical protein